MKFGTTEELAKKFIADGWNSNTSFSELTLDEAKEKGYLFAVNGKKKVVSVLKWTRPETFMMTTER